MKKLILIIMICISIYAICDENMDSTTVVTDVPMGPTQEEIKEFEENMATIYFTADKVYLNGINVTNCLYWQICYDASILIGVGVLTYILLTQ